MPFFDDSGAHSEEHRGPLLRAFSSLYGQVERLVVVSIGWAAQLAPLVAFFAFPGLSLWIRIPLLLYTGCALIPATGVLFGLARRASQGQLLRLDMLGELLRETGLRSLLVLGPLYSLFAWLAALAYLAQGAGLFLLEVLARLAFLGAALVALYWGPLFAARPERPFWSVLGESARLVWRRPLPSLLGFLAVLLAWALGLVSVGGVVLIVPALAALLQTEHYFSAAPGA